MNVQVKHREYMRMPWTANEFDISQLLTWTGGRTYAPPAYEQFCQNQNDNQIFLPMVLRPLNKLLKNSVFSHYLSQY